MALPERGLVNPTVSLAALLEGGRPRIGGDCPLTLADYAHEIEASGFTRDGDYYVNGAYGETEVTIDIDIDGGVGQIELRLED